MAAQTHRELPLGPVKWAGGPIVYLRSTGSTNDKARELASQGAPSGTLVLCDEQTAGRGRHGRSWSTAPFRALTLSLVIRPLRESLAFLPFAAAVAVCESCARCTGLKPNIKWPNDVWIEGRKVAGILIESRPREQWTVLGVGINVNLAPGDFPKPLRSTATSLSIETGREIQREHVLHEFLSSLRGWLERLQGEDSESLLTAYRARDALLGRTISWKQGNRRMSGLAGGVDNDGNLIVDVDGITHRLRSGEVHLLMDSPEALSPD